MAKSVASASKKKTRKRARREMRKDIVERYVKLLQEALGDDEAFMAVYKSMISDKDVQQPEAVGIGSGFVATMAASTPKKTAFERILRRHKNLKKFTSKQKAMGNRSAA